MKPPLIVGLIAIITLIVLITHDKPPEVPNELLERNDGLIIVDSHFVLATSPVYYPVPYTLGTLAEAIIFCESSGRHDVWGDVDYKYPAYGKWQFQERTFYWLADKAGYRGLNWKDESHQDKIGLWALENGYGELWTCFHIINN